MKSYDEIEDIIIDKSIEYIILFAGRLTDKEEPDRVGAMRIKVVDKTEEYNLTKSDLENGILYIGESV